ncbi:MAG: hypothetical protein AAGF90_08810, partial [Pseudomonadota bacterium]
EHTDWEALANRKRIKELSGEFQNFWITQNVTSYAVLAIFLIGGVLLVISDLKEAPPAPLVF